MKNALKLALSLLLSAFILPLQAQDTLRTAGGQAYTVQKEGTDALEVGNVIEFNIVISFEDGTEVVNTQKEGRTNKQYMFSEENAPDKMLYHSMSVCKVGGTYTFYTPKSIFEPNPERAAEIPGDYVIYTVSPIGQEKGKPDMMNYVGPVMDKSDDEIIAKCKEAVAMGDEVFIIETSVNQAGYQLMSMGKMKAATYMFELNIEKFPASSNVYDSMGDCYLAQGNKEKAKANFEKALELNPKAEETKKKLDELK
ncbi:MAG: tetratricopeptide repeat protein [Bacteroidota bacterium]